jgi:hypothetical protein
MCCDRYAEVDATTARIATQGDIDAACNYKSSIFQPILKPYQLVGVNFLLLLHRKGIGGGLIILKASTVSVAKLVEVRKLRSSVVFSLGQSLVHFWLLEPEIWVYEEFYLIFLIRFKESLISVNFLRST